MAKQVVGSLPASLSKKDVEALNRESPVLAKAKLGSYLFQEKSSVVVDFKAVCPACFNDTLVAGRVAPTGTTGDENWMDIGGKHFEYHILGTQTIVAPEWAPSSGLNISMDQTDNDGVEISNGISSSSPQAYTVGSDVFYFSCKFSIADVSGSDDCAVGFRKAEAYQAAIDGYDEMAALNLISGTVTIESILNNAATSSTATSSTVADAGSVTLRLEVGLNGKVKFLVDGSEVSDAVFTFDADEVVIPFFYFLHASDVAGDVILQEWESGKLKQ